MVSISGKRLLPCKEGHMRQGRKTQLNVPNTAKSKPNSSTRLLDGTARVPCSSIIADSRGYGATYGG